VLRPARLENVAVLLIAWSEAFWYVGRILMMSIVLVESAAARFFPPGCVGSGALRFGGRKEPDE
jgi:hypothetical protein